MIPFSLVAPRPATGPRRRVALWLPAVAWFAACLAQAQPPSYMEGTHYERLPVPVETAAEGGVEVVEVFSYVCVHCYTLDPLLEEWRAGLAGDVFFRRVPAVFGRGWAQVARLFYAAQVLGVLDAVHVPVFQAIHQRGLNLTDPAVSASLLREVAGVDRDSFDDAFTSFSVETKLQQAVALSKAYRITGVPTLIVNGKFRIDSKMAGNYQKMLEIADFLIEAERRTGTAAAAKAGE